MNFPEVSVIVSTYNRCDMLKEAIESVLEQSFSDFELIIVDDNSTDNTVEVIDRYMQKDARIRKFKTNTTEEERKTLHGGAIAKNLGLKNMRGQYATYLDDDNLYHQNRLSTLITYLKANPGIDFVYHNQDIVVFSQETGNWEWKETFNAVCDDYNIFYSYEKLIKSNFIDTSAVMYKEHLRDWEWPIDRDDDDWGLWQKMLPHTNVGCINQVLGAYRAHAGTKLSYVYADSNIDIAVEHQRWMTYRKWDHNKAEKIRKYLSGEFPEAQSIGSEGFLASSDTSITTGLVLVNWNTLEFLKKYLKSIEEQTLLPFRLVIVDNGSTDGSQEYIRSLSYDSIINEENRGYGAALNQGYKYLANRMNLKYICISNVDIEVPRGWLSIMKQVFQRDPAAGVVGPLQNYLDCIYSDNFDDRDRLQQADAPTDEDERVDYLMGFCYLIRREIIDEIGFFDERFDMGTYEDVDFCRRVKEAGFHLYLCKKVLLRHYYNASFENNRVEYPQVLGHNKEIFDDKWVK